MYHFYNFLNQHSFIKVHIFPFFPLQKSKCTKTYFAVCNQLLLEASKHT